MWKGLPVSSSPGDLSRPGGYCHFFFLHQTLLIIGNISIKAAAHQQTQLPIAQIILESNAPGQYRGLIPVSIAVLYRSVSHSYTG